MPTNHCVRTYFWLVCACALHLWFVHLPNWNFSLAYHPFNGQVMCEVDNFQRLIFGNSRSPKNFTGKPKIVSLPTSSQESVKHKSTFTFKFTLRTIYKVNVTAWYIERCWPATNNYATPAAFLQHEEDRVSKLMVENRSKIDRNKYVLNQWWISSPQEL